MKKKAVFFDRDGVLNKSFKKRGKPFAPLKFKKFYIYKNLEKKIDKLREKNYLLYVVTNQPDFNKKNKVELNKMHYKLMKKFKFNKIFCSFAKNDFSKNKKPNTGMVNHILLRKSLDLTKSFVIGDRWRDIDFAYNIKCKSIFIDRKYSEKLNNKPNYICKSTSQAINIILNYG